MGNGLFGRPGMVLLRKNIGKNFTKDVTPAKPHIGKKQRDKAAKKKHDRT